jgi:hypothetical protein
MFNFFKSLWKSFTSFFQEKPVSSEYTPIVADVQQYTEEKMQLYARLELMATATKDQKKKAAEAFAGKARTTFEDELLKVILPPQPLGAPPAIQPVTVGAAERASTFNPESVPNPDYEPLPKRPPPPPPPKKQLAPKDTSAGYAEKIAQPASTEMAPPPIPQTAKRVAPPPLPRPPSHNFEHEQELDALRKGAIVTKALLQRPPKPAPRTPTGGRLQTSELNRGASPT